MRRLAFLAFAFQMAAWPVGVQGTPIALDSFDYVAGTLGGKGSATDPGWSGSWTGNAAVRGGGSLAYTDTQGNQLVTAGNRVQTAPDTVFSYRALEGPLLTTNRRQVYLSFLMDDYDVGNRWSGISLYHGNTELFFMGKPGNTPDVGVEVPGGSLIVSHDSFSDPLLFVVVLQLVNNATAAQALFFLNPDLDAPMPNTSAFVGLTNWSDYTIDRIRIAGETGVVFDELRMGTTYGDVVPFTTPVPEPTTLFLLGSGLFVLIALRRNT